MTRLGLLLCASAFGLSLGACGKLFEYPETLPEHDAAACRDGSDNDLDGLTDCGDPSCDDFCAEQSEEECSDGRDNDGDGLTDRADPRCWLLESPHAERCATASGIETIDSFDRPSWAAIDSFWRRWGSGEAGFVVTSSFDPARERKDPLLAFGGKPLEADGSKTELGALVRQRPFSGSFRDLELAFSTSVPAGALLRASIVPLALCPSQDPPLRGAENAFGVTLDGSESPPTLTLDVDGVSFSTRVTEPGCAGAACEHALARVNVEVSSLGSKATLTYPSGETTELAAPPPSSMSLAPSRLVLWGGSSDQAHPALLDDLRLSVAPESPCGYAVPVLSDNSCELGEKLTQLGHDVSVARDQAGAYCALVTASERDPYYFNRGVPLGGATAVTAWQSPDGQSFAPASSLAAPFLELPDGATLIGAGIAADSSLHAAVAYREASGVRLVFLDGSRCDRWQAPESGPVIFADAEAPSYVISGLRHDVYFTRPPTDQTSRTLWRVARRDGSATAPELVAELPVAVNEPVSVGLAGATDLVLTYPSRPGTSGRGGVGLLVADADLSRWRSVASNPVLELPPALDLHDGQGRLAFDDRAIVAAALVWQADAGFFLYSGTATNGLANADTFHPFLAVGTAQLLPAGQDFPDATLAVTDACGDGECKDPEDCDVCAADCACAGSQIVADAFAPGSPWELLSSQKEPEAMRYLDVDPASLRWASGAATWSVLPLEHAVSGDFELSFDMLSAFTDAVSAWGCTVYVGLGTMPPLEAASASDGPAPNAGIFGRFRAFPDWYFPTPLVELEGSRFAGGDEIAPVAMVPMDTWQHITLRREGNQVSLKSPQQSGCGRLERSVSFAGPVPELKALLIGFGGGHFEGCPRGIAEDRTTTDGQGAFRNVSLRLLDDPSACPATKQPCATGAEQPSCVDTAQSAEHCGGCGRRCAANEDCQHGACTCGSAPGILACDGVCVNTLSSVEHCGSCGHACDDGPCIGGTCTITGDCSSPFVIDPEGGSVVLSMPRATTGYSTFCDEQFLDMVVVSWTPARTAAASIGVDVGETNLDPVVGMTVDPACETSWACGDDAVPGELAAPHFTPSVTAGVTYRIAVGIRSSPLLIEGDTVELQIGLSQ